MSRPPDVTPPDGTIAGSAPIFAALGDKTRLQLVSRLSAGGPLSIARLTDGTDLTRQAITKHLHVLSAAGIAHGVYHGREQLWQLEPERLDDARSFLDHVSQAWDESLERLKSLLEG